MKSKLFATILCASAFTAGAQTLTVSFADTTDCSKAVVTVSAERGQSVFDARRVKTARLSPSVLTADSVRLSDMAFAPAWIYVDRQPYQFIIQPGKSLEINVERTADGKPSVSFRGDNAAASEYLGLYDAAFDFDRYFPADNDTVSLSDKQKMLDRDYRSLKDRLSAMPGGEVNDFLARLTDDAYLNYTIRLCGDDRAKASSLLEKVDLNSWVGLYNYLPLWAFDDKLPQPDYDADMTGWGKGYLKAIGEKITDEAVRDYLLANCAMQVLEWGHCDNVDDFWIPFVEFAGKDSKVVRRYADKVKALKSTRSGMKAVDFAFTDPDGNSRRLSDFFGKVVYVDVWASWCGPCRKEIPHIARHFAEYYKGNDKVTFLSISVDESRDAWLKAMEKDAPEWPQFNVTGEDHETLSKAYGITGIPRFMIFNPDGTINNADAFRPSDEAFRKKLDAVINR